MAVIFAKQVKNISIAIFTFASLAIITDGYAISTLIVTDITTGLALGTLGALCGIFAGILGMKSYDQEDNKEMFMIMYDACQTFCYIGMAGCFVGLCWNGFLMSFLTARVHHPYSKDGNIYQLEGWMKDTCDKAAYATCPKVLLDRDDPDIILREDDYENCDNKEDAAAITSVFALYNIEIISLIVVFCLLIALANSDDFCFCGGNKVDPEEDEEMIKAADSDDDDSSDESSDEENDPVPNEVNVIVDLEETQSEVRPKTPVSLFSPSQRSFETFVENDPVTGIDLNGLDDYEDV
ncbi:Oidioi.mRNA.OKI2018_I69.chr1.g1366.t1.cds [Oikopleura dioica]|uniref:Oidioi.mRNA.OKI2018_I69.chr1.g1366.t1.cds n=1 Tax=Oikopleura dioica TaxID=34765 RepID=A0ABN7SMP1_OIKDI|nr:Oidioi.mRNA.OKI2018_I69.chr1.g1366.t1.cds [Oikopleura dioica]